MTQIQIKVDELEKFADQIGKAERDCSQALNAVTWHFNSLLADFPGVLPGGIQDLEAEFKETIRRYKDKLDEAQHLIKMTAGEMRDADQKLAGEIGEFLLEVVGWYDVQRIFAEYDPVTGKKLSAGERALATGMVLATLFPPAKVVGVVGKSAIKGGKALTGTAAISGLSSLAKNSEVFIKMRNVFNPKKVSDAFKVVYNHVVRGPLTVTKLWFDKAFKKIGDLPVPTYLQPQLAGYARVQSSMREAFADAKESVMRMVNGSKIEKSVGVAKKDIDKVEYGEQYTKVNRKKALKPNVEYTTSEGYKYTTDGNGRITVAEAKLELGKANRNLHAQRTVGGNDRLSNDDGGHLIASIFKGSV
ncbi:hypothetical protein CVD25_18735 [Bacillus canaveralius]|uniref:Uncharacterized protein n=1 Tax=Bacillus canaveralius TaxID=1403243 RepID=A0A2N5GI41_9BACI|nr:DNA/RNA non-specific endonuclease [Bacillus canaveralius]PLR80584.1 hypothetical protein CU635_17980 [Bacillus canaveralius]PLR92532.1 hypothetical protein CVD25_18735 [Bacillus canaveralius]